MLFPVPPSCGSLLRLQVVVAHPDDETFGCGSTLLHAAQVGAVTAVTCATRGEAGEVAPRSARPRAPPSGWTRSSPAPTRSAITG